MSNMLAASAEMSAVLDKAIADSGLPAEKKKMFGHETWFLNGYMFCGANVRGIFVHLGRDAVPGIIEREDDTGPFEPGRGMTMKDYLQLGLTICAKEDVLQEWLKRSAEYLLAKPPKIKKPRSKRKRE